MIPVLEIGGTHVTAALVSPRTAAVATRVRRPLDARARAGDILGAVLRCARALPAAPAGARWGVAVPGPFDYATGVALFAGVGKFESLYGVDVRAALLDGLPGSPSGVAFRNDAHAFLAGEWAAGAARGHTRAVGITLGTGVGSAFLADGTLHTTGPGLPPEGRMDLARIDGRPLEEVVSRRAILARYSVAAGAGGGTVCGGTGSGGGPGFATGSGSAGEYGGPPGEAAGASGRPRRPEGADGAIASAGAEAAVDVREIAERARAGEERARRVLDAAFGALGAELGPRLAAFGATALVVGGSMAESWDLVAPPLTTGLTAGGWRPAAGTEVHGVRAAGDPGRPEPARSPRSGGPAGGPPLPGGPDGTAEPGGTPAETGPQNSAGPPPGSRRLVRALLGEDAGLIGAAAAVGGAG
ncbi:ROK family protein [Streptomyces sp. WAC 06738]|uniref:ROK family protein n=1 Tax=Streptomyces sp. WAC 06738 TaxID=2203210 RepID=UPI000F6FFE4B|nr:ROK family protein [Streptomyces sp. WAC 06738]AZM44847.1 ROK family protein [Streptomyces sp. WAC 06738]